VKIYRPFRTVAKLPYSSGYAEPDLYSSFRPALKRAALVAKQVGEADVTKVVSKTPWRSKLLARCIFRGRKIERSNPRYGKMRHTNYAVCTLTKEGKQLIKAAKARRKRRRS